MDLSTWWGWLKWNVIGELMVTGSVVRGLIGFVVNEDVEQRLLVGLPKRLVEFFQEVEGSKPSSHLLCGGVVTSIRRLKRPRKRRFLVV